MNNRIKDAKVKYGDFHELRDVCHAKAKGDSVCFSLFCLESHARGDFVYASALLDIACTSRMTKITPK